MGSYAPVLRIAIIGAGPVGTACAKYLLAERAFDKIDIYEQRDRVGGIWNLSKAERTTRIPIPQENPNYGSLASTKTLQDATKDGTRVSSVNHDSLEFESPLYDYLETNIPKKIMMFSDTPFPDRYPLYPSHSETLEYLERYADDVRDLIKFETQIQNVRLVDEIPDTMQAKWEVTAQDLRTSTMGKSIYDAVIVASGHYTVPHVVSVSGLAEWNQAYPGSIIHSKAYRLPEPFTGQRVLVIGNSASGTDLAFQIGPLSSRLYLSSKSVSPFSTDTQFTWREDIDEVTEFLPAEQYYRAVRTKSGKVVENLDTVIFATGYFYSFPFLSELDPPLITDGLRTRDMYQHFLHIEHPTLALPVLNHKIIPFSLAENQAAVIARLWSGRLELPSKDEMRHWEEETFRTNGKGKHFHLKKFPEEAVQMNDLYDWAASATPKKSLEGNGIGKLGLRWNQRRVWVRSKFMDIKMAYSAKGTEKRNVHNIEELGFDYDKWRESARPEDMEMFRQAGLQPPGKQD